MGALSHAERELLLRLVVLGSAGGPAPPALAWAGALARSGARLGAVAPAARVRVEVVGPLRVLLDGRPSRSPELRRRRVRELLALLAVRGELERARLTELLWPDLGPDASARNLRVTLTYLRRVLEPGRSRGEPAHHLRVDRERVGLARSDLLEVDLVELRERLTEARRATGAGDSRAVEAGLAAAVRLWRGEPLTELARLPELAAEITAVSAGLTQAALVLGERRLAEGDTVEALTLAERALGADPYAERGLRLLLAVALRRRNPVTIDLTARRVEATLASLGVPPEPATALALRQAAMATVPHRRRPVARRAPRPG